jgi:Domain of unknown function (DUF4386)
MGTDRFADWFGKASPRSRARLAGTFYLLNIVTSLVAFSGKGGHWLGVTSGLAATASYVAVTVLLYYLFKPVNRTVSLVAALFSLAGCADGYVAPPLPFKVHPLVFFGCYCLLIGYLILRSTFVPRILGVLMAMAGLGWLTFVYGPLANSLAPYHYIMGGIGEGLLTLWLLVMGVDSARWKEQASSGEAVAG